MTNKQTAVSRGTKRKNNDTSDAAAAGGVKRAGKNNGPLLAVQSGTKRKRYLEEENPERELSKRTRREHPEFGLLMNISVVKPNYFYLHDTATGEMREHKSSAPPPATTSNAPTFSTTAAPTHPVAPALAQGAAGQVQPNTQATPAGQINPLPTPNATIGPAAPATATAALAVASAPSDGQATSTTTAAATSAGRAKGRKAPRGRGKGRKTKARKSSSPPTSPPTEAGLSTGPTTRDASTKDNTVTDEPGPVGSAAQADDSNAPEVNPNTGLRKHKSSAKAPVTASALFTAPISTSTTTEGLPAREVASADEPDFGDDKDDDSDSGVRNIGARSSPSSQQPIQDASDNALDDQDPERESAIRDEEDNNREGEEATQAAASILQSIGHSAPVEEHDHHGRDGEDTVMEDEIPTWPRIPAFTLNTAIVKTLVGVFMKPNPNAAPVFGVCALSTRQIREMVAYRKKCQAAMKKEDRKEYDYVYCRHPPDWTDKFSADTPEEINRGTIEPAQKPEEWNKQVNLVSLERCAAIYNNYRIPHALSFAEREEHFDIEDLREHVSFEERLLQKDFDEFVPLGDEAPPVDRLAMIRAFQADLAFSTYVPGSSHNIEPDNLENPDRSHEFCPITIDDKSHRQWHRGLKWSDRHYIITTGNITAQERKYIAKHSDRFTETEREIALESIQDQRYNLRYDTKAVTTEHAEALDQLRDEIAWEGYQTLPRSQQIWARDYLQWKEHEGVDSLGKDCDNHMAMLKLKSFDKGRPLQSSVEALRLAQAEQSCIQGMENDLRHSSGQTKLWWQRDRPWSLWNCDKWQVEEGEILERG